ncbi:DUF192 domain-containing protein [Winogradskyella rapida]|uniref:DUF192 domain-containing protein n=1 Tax=Winogradskyella rapida TaxID=549701 RepID=A0ABW3KSE8_9FLAO
MPSSSFIKTLLLFIVLGSFASCKEDQQRTKTDKVVVSFKKEGTLHLKKAETAEVIKTLAIEVADDDYSIQTGLMYRTSLETNQGMLFIFPDEQMRNFYMKNTKIPLDIIYINKAKTIVSIQKQAQPMDLTSLPSEAPATYVLEINGGLSDSWGLQIGDRIDFDLL